MIPSSKLKHLTIPQFEGLSIHDMLDYANKWPIVMRCLPIEKEIKKLPRQYIANVIYTKCGEQFSKWVDRRVEARNDKIKAE